jgi:hypothetical protein
MALLFTGASECLKESGLKPPPEPFPWEEGEQDPPPLKDEFK